MHKFDVILHWAKASAVALIVLGHHMGDVLVAMDAGERYTIIAFNVVTGYFTVTGSTDGKAHTVGNRQHSGINISQD